MVSINVKKVINKIKVPQIRTNLHLRFSQACFVSNLVPHIFVHFLWSPKSGCQLDSRSRTSASQPHRPETVFLRNLSEREKI